MDKSELKYIQDMHDKLDALERAELYDEAEKLLRDHWYTFSFDRNGKWLGEMKNENGWTA